MDVQKPITPSTVKVVKLEEEILAANDVIAAENRELLRKHKIYTVNLISSPGSGKTTLLVETIKALQGKLRCAVIEGDQQTTNDADRIAQTGVPVVQINTISACHLDAAMVRKALTQLPLDEIDLLFIENVGNLVCPAGYDLGEQEKVVLMSVTEGEDKPIKYPLAFHLATVLLLTKVDLIPHLQFDKTACINNAYKIHPTLPIIETSSYTKEGMSTWVEWLLKKQAK